MKKPAWPAKPKRSKHPDLGTRQTWLRSDGRAMVERFIGGSGQYIPAVTSSSGEFRPIFGCRVRTLSGAQRACQRRLEEWAMEIEAGERAESEWQKESRHAQRHKGRKDHDGDD